MWDFSVSKLKFERFANSKKNSCFFGQFFFILPELGYTYNMLCHVVTPIIFTMEIYLGIKFSFSY